LKFTDYPPIQTTSVPSEQVFSSSTETGTKRQNCTSAMLMEAPQMLKLNYKKSRLNFMADWQTVPIVDSCNSADGIIFTETPEENK
ncbi:hypothetical protein B0H14DRAFT_2894537, partial [Mycena olivaceomarginata]